jgi:hypothetical protein
MVGFIPTALNASEGDGVVTGLLAAGILNGGITEQRAFFVITYNSGSKKLPYLMKKCVLGFVNHASQLMEAHEGLIL